MIPMGLEKTLKHPSLTALLKFALLQTEVPHEGSKCHFCWPRHHEDCMGQHRNLWLSSITILVKLSLSSPHIHVGVSKAKGGSLASPDSQHQMKVKASWPKSREDSSCSSASKHSAGSLDPKSHGEHPTHADLLTLHTLEGPACPHPGAISILEDPLS